MSHELRTPLNAILGFSDLLRDRCAPDQRQDLDSIHRSGEHLLGLINDVLDMAKIEAGRTVLQYAPCDVKALVHDVTDMLRGRASEKNLALVLERAANLPQWIKTDAAKLRQVLINLLSNSIKFTERGSVALRAGIVPSDDPLRVRLTFEVADTGIGISPEDQARIFEGFVQAGQIGPQQGTGLGLTIVRQFVELMGGHIRLESSPGAGSVFRVELPVELPLESEWEAPAPKLESVIDLEAGQPEYRVLVVDDDFNSRSLLVRLLDRAGFSVQAASDGAQAVDIFPSWRPHFIWMDMHMPGTDGQQAARLIRALEGGKDVKIAALTASVFAHQRNELVGNGFDDFVRKPYRPDEIFDCLARHLNVRYNCRKTATEGEVISPLRPENLASLPQALRADLHAALISLDGDRIAAVIGDIAAWDAPLGATLAHLADSYAYSGILGVLKAVN